MVDDFQSNCRSLMLEATSLSTGPQPLPEKYIFQSSTVSANHDILPCICSMKLLKIHQMSRYCFASYFIIELHGLRFESHWLQKDGNTKSYKLREKEKPQTCKKISHFLFLLLLSFVQSYLLRRLKSSSFLLSLSQKYCSIFKVLVIANMLT